MIIDIEYKKTPDNEHEYQYGYYFNGVYYYTTPNFRYFLYCILGDKDKVRVSISTCRKYKYYVEAIFPFGKDMSRMSSNYRNYYFSVCTSGFKAATGINLIIHKRVYFRVL